MFGKPARFVANSRVEVVAEDDTNFYIYVAGTTVTVNPLDTLDINGLNGNKLLSPHYVVVTQILFYGAQKHILKQ